MSVTKEDVLRCGKLARIKINDVEKVSAQLSGIFNWIDKLNEAYKKVTDTTLVENIEFRHLERPDQTPSNDQRNLVLQNAPHRAHDFFVVPKVKE